MGYSIHLGAWNSVFAVPSCVVDEHIRLAGAASLKVLLYLLRNAGNPIDAAQISSALALSEADIQDALNYWVEARLLCADGDGLRPAGKAANAPAQAEN
ncbi:MAG: helicase DnaB, partial [Oscillospiraceae bacterium]